jgi:23S rRNA (cytidine1920-2'-O)/16S rRNA (cytidine1409-2'-O)-methyltransferase
MKQRLDLILVERGLATSRSLAQAMIMAGEVSHATTKLTKPGQTFDQDIKLELSQKSRYVSRGGDKLASVAQALGLDFKGKVVLDVGSSTGGFTDYALQHGAQHVYAVDVGTNQLAYKLRQDDRITIMERTDIRDLEPAQVDTRPGIAVIDVSFVSLTKILSSVASLIKSGGQIVAMAKPQFETDKPTADRYKGVISDPKVRQQILEQLEAWLGANNFEIINSADSAVHGAQGNIERFYLLTYNSEYSFD